MRDGAHLKEHQFKPGQSGCPGGKPKWWLTNGRMKDLISLIGSLPIAEVQLRLENPKTPAMEAFICKVYLKGIELGDTSRLSVLLDRTVGKPVEVVEQHNVNHDAAYEKANEKSRDELLDILRKSEAA